MWHSHLDHSSLPIFHKFLSVLSISFPKEHLCSFSCNSCNVNKIHKLPFAKSSLTSSSHFFFMFRPHPFPLLMISTTTLFLLTITQSTSGFTHYVVNRMFIQPFSRPMVSPISLHLPTHLNIMGTLNAEINILSKWVSLSCIKPPSLLPFGRMLLLKLSI